MGCYHPYNNNCNDAALAMLGICDCINVSLPPDCITSTEQLCEQIPVLANRLARCKGDWSYKKSKEKICKWIIGVCEGAQATCSEQCSN